MSANSLAVLAHGARLALSDVPRQPFAGFREAVVGGVHEGARLAALCALPEGQGIHTLLAALAHGPSAEIRLAATEVGRAYPALTPDCPQAHLFERDLAERSGIDPAGHPGLAPVRLRTADDAAHRGFVMEGTGVHEVAVGPIHAGVIEPGHFRFQCHGERVFHLAIALGYQHRGAWRALLGGPTKRTIPVVETLAGDTSVGHATAYAQAVEALADCRLPERGAELRAVALELERMANHAGDLGALAGDVGYLPSASFCGRLRGDFLNMTALVCGSRLGRGWIRPGGVAFDADPARAAGIVERLGPTMRDFLGARELLRSTSTVRARFEETGTLGREACLELGIVGPPARAAGLERDARKEFPSGAYLRSPIPVATWTTGDVFARARVRWMEVEHSATYVARRLRELPDGPIRAEVGPLAPSSITVSLVEGWRGEICHLAITDDRGSFRAYEVVDPSFHNWAGLALALRDQAISDFPLCNKSFNLSYCGCDL